MVRVRRRSWRLLVGALLLIMLAWRVGFTTCDTSGRGSTSVGARQPSEHSWASGLRPMGAAKCSPSLRGRVLSAATDRPIPGAQIDLMPGSSGVTSRTGTFAVCGALGSLTARLSVSHPSFAPYVETIATSRRSPITVRLVASSAIALKLVDRGGDPVAGTQVVVGEVSQKWAELGNKPATATTDMTGVALFEDVRPGRYRIVEIDGDWLVRGCELHAPWRGQQSCVAYPGAAISAVVTADGRPVRGVPVEVARADSRSSARADSRYLTRTDNTGRFEIRNVEPGEYTIEVRGVVLEPDQPPLSSGERTHIVRVAAFALLSGYVRERGVLSPGAVVDYQIGAFQGETVADAQGYYEILARRHEESMIVRARSRRGVLGAAVLVESSEWGAALDLSIGPQVHVRGVIVGGDGRPRKGVVVMLEDPRAGVLASGVSGDDGVFDVEVPQEELSYDVRFRADQGNGRELAVVSDTELSFHATESVDLGQVVVDGALGSLAGRVVNARGEPASGIRVLLLPADIDGSIYASSSFFESSDSAGKFVFRDVPVDRYELVARTSEGFDVRLGHQYPGAGEVLLELPDVRALSGSVRGFVIPPQHVEACADHYRTCFSAQVWGGVYALVGLPADSYRVRALGGEDSGEVTVDLTAADGTGVEIVAGGLRRIEIMFQESGQAQLKAGALCFAIGEDGGSRSKAGYAQLFVPRGKYLVTCTPADPVNEWIGNVVVDVSEADARVVLPWRRADYAGARFLGIRFARRQDATIVEQVLPGGPADRAGLRPGDHIVTVETDSVAEWEPGQVRILLIDRPAGDQVVLTVLREGRVFNVSVIVADKPPDAAGWL